MSAGIGRTRALRSFARSLGCADLSGPALARIDSALTHDSYAFERRSGAAAASNERLEFLGDAVIGAAVSDALFAKHPDEAEGRLSRRKAQLVSRSALAAAALRMGVDRLILLGKGEAGAHGERRPSILAGAFESVVGAVYLNEGYPAAQRLLERVHLATAQELAAADPKTALQELAQARYKTAPAYVVTEESGPAHSRAFTVSVSVGRSVLASARGPSKKEAQAAAAAEALARLAAASARDA
ncbi:MAG: ribonuclease III [Candidatus Eremiobacteraeota bacterium]|nr:ribonuclease III [Candidatus Eremiobacteraeota bacterium]